MHNKYLSLIGFLATIPLANWMIGNVGNCIPNGPCVIPVGLGLSAPSGVLLIGLALVLRDVVHKTLGKWWTVSGIVIGAALSALISPAIALASGVSFLLSELADMAIYAPLMHKHKIHAVFWSGVVGSIVDSGVFLWLAFGSLDFIVGQVVGKMWMTLLVVLVLNMIAPRPPKHYMEP